MRSYRPMKDIGVTVVITLIILLLLKILFVPNPLDVIVLGGLIFLFTVITRR